MLSLDQGDTLDANARTSNPQYPLGKSNDYKLFRPPIGLVKPRHGWSRMDSTKFSSFRVSG